MTRPPSQQNRRRPRLLDPIQPLEPRRLLSSSGDALQWLEYARMQIPISNGLLFQQMQAAEPTPTARPAKTPVATSPQHHKPARSSPASAASETLTGSAAASSPSGSAADVLTGSLAGRVLFTSGGHGYVWRPEGYWGIMRSYGYNFMEDMGNQDQIQPYADYALHSGATVVAMRPVGHQVNEYVMDNAMGYSASTGGFQVVSGSWTGNTSTTPYWSVNNGNDTNHWMFAAASSTETAVARYTPNIPAAGFYPVYEWTNPGTDNSSNDRVDDQTYRINYTGGSVEVKVTADKVGNGWVYLGTYYFAQGVSGANVEVSNKTSGATAGKYVVADGIRFGNGMGDWTEYGTHPVSGYSREDECALYWCYDSLGWTGNNARVNNNVVDAGFNVADENKNFFACDRYATYMNNSNVGSKRDRLWISFHSNASGSSGTGAAGRGTYGLVNSTPTTNQVWLAETAGYTVQQEMIAAGYNWASKDDGNPSTTDDNVYYGGYSEISNGSTYINGEFDATIVEVAYHDNATDNALLKDPGVRDAVGRASYHSAVKYFQTFGSLSNTTVLPEPPVDVRTITDASGNVTVSWDPGASSPGLNGPYGNAATSYRVHTSANGYGFDGGVVTTGTSLTFSGLSISLPTYFMVTAVNSGGESMNSYVVVAKPQAGRRAPVLIVNNFDRMDGISDEIETKSFGTVYRARARYNNSHSYVVQAASSVSAFDANLGIESVTDESIALGQVNLSDYQAVIWMSGEQSSNLGGTFRGAAAAAVANYVSAGGKLFVSGSEVAWDLGHLGNGTSFLANTLHAAYVSDDAATHNFNAGVAGTALASVPAGAFDDGTHGTYDVDFPDVLGAGSGAQVAMYYSGGTKAAAVQWSGAGNAKVVYLGFPLESVYNQSTRNAVVAGALGYFGVSSTGVPAITPTPGTPDLAAGSDLGPVNNDDVTSRNNAAGRTLQFTVPNTVPGAVVQLFADGTLVGQATATTTSTVITTNGTVALANGTRLFTAVQTSPGLNASAASAALAVTVDTAAPGVAFFPISSTRTDALASVSINFSEPVYGLTPSDLTLFRDNDTFSLGTAQTDTLVGNTHVIGNLAPLTGNAGLYSISLYGPTSGVTDLAGNPLVGSVSAYWAMTSVNGTSGNDTVVLTRVASDPAVVSVAVNGAAPYSLNASWLGELSIDTGAGEDSVTLDFSAGNLASNVSLSVLTGAASTADSISVIGTSGDDTLGATASTLRLNGGPTISYSTTAASPVSLSFAGGTGNDTLSLTGRSVAFPADASLATSNLTLNLGTGASATFGSTQHLAALNLSDSASASLASGGNKVLVTSSLTMTGTSRFDLTDNDLAVNAGLTNDQARQLLLGGRLFSSAATGTTGIGYALASSLGRSTFSDQPVLPGAMLFKFTYHGDTDLDGRVTADDLARIDRGRAKGMNTWLAGDSNYDAVVDAADLTLAYGAFANPGPTL